MRVGDFPFLADWFAISLRWLTLLGLAIALALTGQLTIYLSLVLLVMALWSIYGSGLAILNRRMLWHRPVNVVLDVAATLVLFWLSHDILGALTWVGLLGLFSAAVYYDSPGSILVCLVISLGEIGVVSLGSPLATVKVALVEMVVFNVLVGIGLAFISRKLITGIRNNYQAQVRRRREVEAAIKKQEFDRLRAFYNLTSTLSATLNYQTVLDSGLDLGAKMMEEAQEVSNLMVSVAMLFEKDQLKIRASRRLGPADDRTTLPGRQGLLACALNSAEPCVGVDPAQDPELDRIVALRTCKSVVALALRSGLDVFGVLLFAHPDAGYFNMSRCEVLEIVSRQEVIGIQNARLYHDLELQKDHLVDIQEETRRKLARDLHDGPIQSVAGIAMRVNFAQKLLERDPNSIFGELDKIEDLAKRSVQELRHLLFTLRPLVLETEGLEAALRTIAEKTRETYQQNVTIDVDGKIVGKFEIGKQSAVFYIVEEAVNNARKHAKADHIWVSLKPYPQIKDLAVLEVRDDGLGFNVDEINSSYDQRGSLGLINLRERTELVRGDLNIQSSIGKGTCVTVYIPLSEEAADKLRRGI